MNCTDKIYSYIADRYFMLAIIEIRNIIKKYPEKVSLDDSLNDIEMVVRQMIQYNSNGIVDSQQDNIVRKIGDDLMAILDDLNFYISTNDFKKAKNIKITNSIDRWESINLSGNVKDNQLALVSEIFYQIVFDENVKKISICIKHILTEDNVDDILKQSVCSAVLLRLLLSFDKSLFLIVFQSLLKENNPAIKTRLYTTFIFVIIRYYSRIKQDSDLIGAIKLILGDENHYNSILELLKIIIKSTDTQRICNKIQNGLLKEVAKYSSEIKYNPFKVDDDNNLNPKWMEIVENKDIAEKVKEFQDLQLNGRDVYYITFHSMKFYPFFGDMSNWFLPFISDHPSLSVNQEDNNTIQVFSKMNQFCDSDKYSFFLGLSQFPKNMIDSIISTSGEEIDQLKEDQVGEEWKNKLSLSKNPSFARSYIQDLYRFFYCSLFAKYFSNPFVQFVDFFLHLKEDNILLDSDVLRDIADRFFEIEQWNVCCNIYHNIENKSVWDLFFYQRYAFSFQKMKSYNEAVSIYNKAGLIDNNDVWCLRQKAFCYLQLNDIQSAIDCYNIILLQNENNIPVLNKLAGCYYSIKEYEKAKNILFKVDFLTENNSIVHKFLGWILFLLGNKDDAFKYYNQLYEDNAFSEDDYVKAGCIFLVNKEKQKAIHLFVEYLNVSGSNDAFIKKMDENYENIKQYITLEEYKLFINQIFLNV